MTVQRGHSSSLVALLGSLALLAACAGDRPAGLGPQQDGLAPCPSTPNCVSSQADDADHRVEPLRFEGAPETALRRLERIIEALPRARVVSRGKDYMHAEFRSRVFGFVDDVEFLLAPADGLIHVRSASRVGYSDLGVNRERVAELRRRFDDGGTET